MKNRPIYTVQDNKGVAQKLVIAIMLISLWMASFSAAYLTIFCKIHLLITIFIGIFVLGLIIIPIRLLFELKRWRSQKRLRNITKSLSPHSDEEFLSLFPKSQWEMALTYRAGLAEELKIDPNQVHYKEPVQETSSFSLPRATHKILPYDAILPKEYDSDPSTPKYPFESLALSSGSPWFMEQHRRLLDSHYFITPIRIMTFFIKVTEQTAKVFQEFNDPQASLEGTPDHLSDPPAGHVNLNTHLFMFLIAFIVLFIMYSPWIVVGMLAGKPVHLYINHVSIIDLGIRITLAMLLLYLGRRLWNRWWNNERAHNKKTLKKQPLESENEFLSHFPVAHHALAAIIQKSLAKKLRVSTKHIRHDTPLALFAKQETTETHKGLNQRLKNFVKLTQPSTILLSTPVLKDAIIEGCDCCWYLSRFSFYQRNTAVWWDRNIKRLCESGATVETFIKVIAYIEKRLGEVLKDLDFSVPPENERLANKPVNE